MRGAIETRRTAPCVGPGQRLQVALLMSPSIRNGILGAVALCLPSIAVATPLTLRQAVQSALENGPAARIAEFERRRAEEAAAAARSAYWPRAQVASRAGYSNRLNERLRAVDATGREFEYGLLSLGASEGWFNFYVHQILFDLARWADTRRVGQEAEVARLVEAEQRDRLSFEVLQAYVAVLHLAALSEQQEMRRRHAVSLDERAAVHLRAGRCLEAEREEAALYRHEVEIEAASLDAELRGARRNLALLAALDPSEADEPLVAASLSAAMGSGDATPELADAAPDVRVLGLQLAIEESRLEAARASRYPTVGVGAGYSHYGVKRFDNFPDELRAGIDFRMSVFDGFQSGHSVAAAEQGVAVARLRHAAARDAKRQHLEELMARLEAARRQAEIAPERIRLANERIRLADLALDTQRGSVTLALAARREVERTKRAALHAVHEPILIWAEAQRTVGRLAEHIAAGDD